MTYLISTGLVAFVLGLVVGIAACEIAGRHAGGYSVVLDAIDWAKRLG